MTMQAVPTEEQKHQQNNKHTINPQATKKEAKKQRIKPQTSQKQQHKLTSWQASKQAT